MTEPTPDNLSPTKRALLALQQMQAKLDQLEAAQHEPIAIIGMGCRFPGAADLEAFWQLLQQQQDAITKVPSDRWDANKYYDTDPDHPGTMISPDGGWLANPLDFDAAFFRIAPREAVSLDPQQRLLLEVSWEALEHAGLAADRLMGSSTGIFVGICSIDYWQRLLSRSVSNIDAYLTTGNTHSLAAGRLSYIYGFTGPSLALDTACSSSLVAVHSACQSLRQRECDLALAGGVNCILEPATSINFAKARMLSASGRCKTFDAEADGFVRSEGCGVVVLKRWQDAIRDRDVIWAMILGSAVNHDGRASGLTVPNGTAQQALIRQALQQSRIQPSQVSLIETHGTGTALGDSIEVNALNAVFSERQQPLILGAVKTNIGHTEAAAGMAGLIKTVLALHHQVIPANLHLQTPNPRIDWSASLQLPHQPLPWPQGEIARIAGISAFGFNGTNAHVVVSDQPVSNQPLSGQASANPLPASQPSVNQASLAASPTENAAQADQLSSEPLHLFTLSAKTEKALGQLAERYYAYLNTHPEISINDLCYSAYMGRSHFNYRLAILATSLSELQEKLASAINHLTESSKPLPDNIYLGRTTSSNPLLLQSSTSPLLQQAQAYINGAMLTWTTPGRKIVLPTYPFQRQRYGIERM